MHLKYTLKAILRAPFAYLGFFILLTLSMILFLIQFSVYKKGDVELNKIKSSYKVIGSIEEKEEISYLSKLPGDTIEAILTSKYIDSHMLIVPLAGTIKSWTRLPYPTENMSPENQLFIKGHVIEGSMNADEKYELQIEIEIVEYGVKKSKIVKTMLSKDYNIDYSDLLSGSSYYFGIGRDVGSNQVFCLQSSKEFEEKSLENTNSYKRDLNHIIDTINRFPIYYTNQLSMIYNFYNNRARLVAGRGFTKEEYQQDEKVCILSDALASKYNVKVKDTITLNGMDTTTAHYNNVVLPYSRLNTFYEGNINTKTIFDDFLIQKPTTYTVVGIYHSSIKDTSDKFYIDYNTIYLPYSSSRDTSAFLRYSNTFTFQLKDPDKQSEFLEELKGKSFDGTQYKVTIYDKGYYLIKGILTNMKKSAVNLFIISGAAILLLLSLFTYFYTHSKRREFAITRVMGESKYKASGIVLQGILITGIPAVLLGGIAAYCLSQTYITKAYQMGLELTKSQGLLEGEYSKAYEFAGSLPVSVFLLPIGLLLILLLVFGLAGCILFVRKPLIHMIHQ